ncbi:ATP synthase subunit I [Bacillus altitudinis]|uniref:ATP synthase subunit I n=1 Tax=Bacillus pumilus TaxID=1408 RepID=UPI0025A206EE|nr:ATP synthase subunit I [Bacillus pumilus]MDM5321753.1 ATP synthase subunit I [Bacillus pumilus]MDR4994798.1 ATP synthase subunit I [Bacillus altitudinis]
MDEPNLIFRRQSKCLLYILAAFVLGYALPSYKTIFLGLIIGTLFSFFNLLLVIRRMNAFDHSIETGKPVRSLGSAARWCNGLIAVAIAWRYPEYVHLVGIVFGLMTIYPVIMIDSFIQLKRSTTEER